MAGAVVSTLVVGWGTGAVLDTEPLGAHAASKAAVARTDEKSTAGTTALQDVMFLGNEPNALALAVLGAYVVVSFGIAYMWLRRRQVA